MALGDYNKTKKLDIDSVSGTPTVDKAQPILLTGQQLLVKEFDGFEDGDFTSNPIWSESASGDTATVQSTTVKNGSFALQLNEGTSNDKILSHDRGSSDSISDGDVYQCWINTSDASTLSGYFTIGNTDDIFGNDASEIFLDSGNVDAITRDGSGNILNSEIVASYSANEWILLSIEFDTVNSDTVFRVYDSDKNLLGEQTLGNSGATNLQYVNLIERGGVDTFFDDVSYSTSDSNTYFIDDSDRGNGDIVLDWTNISGPEDIAVYDQDGNLLDYEIEDLDTTAETGVLWVYNSWVRDGTTQAQVVYGDNSANTDRQNVTGTWDNTGQNAEFVQHLQESTSPFLDSTSNNWDSTNTTGTNQVSTEFNGGRNLDGVDDEIEFGDRQIDWSEITVVAWTNLDDTSTEGDIITEHGDSTSEGWGIRRSNGSWFVNYSNSGFGNLSRSTSINTNTVYNWIATASSNSGNLRLYINGSEDAGSPGETNLSGNLIDSTEPIRLGSSFDSQATYDGWIDEVRIYRDEKGLEWAQADYDASPKAGQVFFSQQAAESTVQTQETTFTQTISIKNEDVTEGFSQTLIIENENVPEQFTQDVAVKDRDIEQTLDTDVAIQDKNVEQNFTQDVTVKDFDAEQTFSQDVSLQETDQQAQFNQDVILSAGNIEAFNNTVVIKIEDAEKQFSQDLILENANIPEQFTQDVAVKNRDVEVTFTQSIIVADKDVTEQFTQDVVVSMQMENTFDNSVVIAKQPAPRAENPLKVDTVQDTQTFVETLKPTETNVELKELKRD